MQGQVNSKKYLKNLSIATGVAAVDNLISKVEEELDKSTKDVPTNSQKVFFFFKTYTDFNTGIYILLFADHEITNGIFRIGTKGQGPIEIN